MGLGVAQLQNVSLRSLFSSAGTMQAQHYAKTKMDYLVYRGYNALAAQSKTSIESTEFQDRVVLSAASTDADGLSHRLVTVEVYKDNEVLPRASLNQVFYSNDANKYVHNDSSPTDSISLKYADGKLIATVNGEEEELGGVPVGTILPWYGKLDAIPDGYALCNGANGTPDLRNRFVVGAGDVYKVSDIGGKDKVVLEESDVAKHRHFIIGKGNNAPGGSYWFRSLTDSNYLAEGWGGGGMTESYALQGADVEANIGLTSYAGIGTPTAHENRPPYYAVYYIMRIS